MNSLFDIIYVPFGYVLRFFNQICGGHYILTLLLFAVTVKVLMIPFSIKQQKNQVKGAMLRPKMAIIEKKYAGKTDQASLMQKRQELMDMQQREGYNPLAGCLPLLIQMPIIMALYRIIRCPLTYICRFSEKLVAEIYNVATTLKDSPVFGADTISTEGDVVWKTIKNIDQIKLVSTIKHNSDAFTSLEGFSLDTIPNFDVFGGWINLTETPSFRFGQGANPWLLLIPVLTFATAIITSKLSKKYNGTLQQELAGQTDEQRASSAMMEWSMPLMSLAFTFMLNAALGVYWVYQSVISIGQMVLFNKIWPMPTFTPEQIREYERSLKRKPKPSAPDPNRPKPRSLHHIDDDDDI